jgi:hypothetical protein
MGTQYEYNRRRRRIEVQRTTLGAAATVISPNQHSVTIVGIPTVRRGLNVRAPIIRSTPVLNGSPPNIPSGPENITVVRTVNPRRLPSSHYLVQVQSLASSHNVPPTGGGSGGGSPEMLQPSWLVIQQHRWPRPTPKPIVVSGNRLIRTAFFTPLPATIVAPNHRLAVRPAIVIKTRATAGLGFVPPNDATVVPLAIGPRARSGRSRLPIILRAQPTYPLVHPNQPVVVPRVYNINRNQRTSILVPDVARTAIPNRSPSPRIFVVPQKPLRRPPVETILQSTSPLAVPRPIPAGRITVVRGPRLLARKAAPVIIIASPIRRINNSTPQYTPLPKLSVVRPIQPLISAIKRPLLVATPYTPADGVGMPPDLIAACISWLRQSVAVASAFGDSPPTGVMKFGSDIQPPGEVLPYATFSEPMEIESFETGGGPSLVEGMFTIEVMASGKLLVRQLTALVESRLQDAPLVFEGGDLFYLRRTDRRFPIMENNGPESETAVFKRKVEFAYKFERTA